MHVFRATYIADNRKMSKKEGGVKQGEKDVSALYTELQTYKQNDEYEKAIKVRERLSFVS